jgi:hypothetical protein
MLRQEPELEWLLMTPLPTASSRKTSVDPEVYRQQVLAAMAELSERPAGCSRWLAVVKEKPYD